MKAWGELLSYEEQLKGYVDTAGLRRLIKDAAVVVLDSSRKYYRYGIFRVITLANCDAPYTFYGAGFHKYRGYIFDRWVFDIDLSSVEPLTPAVSKKSVLVTLAKDGLWFERRARKRKGVFSLPATLLDDDRELEAVATLEEAKSVVGSLTAYESAIVSPSPNYKCVGPNEECHNERCKGGPCPEI